MASAEAGPSAGARRAPTSLARAARDVGVFALVLALCCGAVGAGIARVRDQRLLGTVKHAYYQGHREEFELVFVGSSRMYRQVDPALFDAEVARRGIELASFNLGTVGMWFPEIVYTVEWVLAQRAERLAWLVIELGELDPDVHAENLLNRRNVNWHTPAITLAVCRAVLAGEHAPLEKLRRLGDHLTHLVYRLGSLGTGTTAVSYLLGDRRQAGQRRRWNGLVLLEDDPRLVQQLEERRAAFLADLPGYEERVAALVPPVPAGEPPAPLRALLERLVARVRAAGVEPVFVIPPPSDARLEGMVQAARAGVLPNLLAYNRPQDYPEFYAVQSSLDGYHLNSVGAERFTRQLAADFAALARRGGR
jgi:hypothetical protein